MTLTGTTTHLLPSTTRPCCTQAEEPHSATENVLKKRKYNKKREKVPGRESKKNPWKFCTCLPQAILDARGGRTYHKSFCPIERWLVDASFGEPADGEVCVVTASAGARAGEKAVYKAATKKWAPLP